MFYAAAECLRSVMKVGSLSGEASTGRSDLYGALTALHFHITDDAVNRGFLGHLHRRIGDLIEKCARLLFIPTI